MKEKKRRSSSKPLPDTAASVTTALATENKILEQEVQTREDLESQLKSEQDADKQKLALDDLQAIKRSIKLRKMAIGRLKKKLLAFGPLPEDVPSVSVDKNTEVLGKRQGDVNDREDGAKRARQLDGEDDSNTGLAGPGSSGNEEQVPALDAGTTATAPVTEEPTNTTNTPADIDPANDDGPQDSSKSASPPPQDDKPAVDPVDAKPVAGMESSDQRQQDMPMDEAKPMSEDEDEEPAQKRLPDRWDKLSKAQKEKFIKKGRVAFKDFKKSCICPNVDIRTWARRAQEFFPEAGTYCRLLAIYCLILKGNVTRCPHHTSSDHSSKINDVAVRDGSLVKRRLPFSVTGVHWAPSEDAVVPPLTPEALKAMAALQQKLDGQDTSTSNPSSGSGSDSDSEIDSWRLIGISMASKLEEAHRLFRVENNRRVLNCGCDLEEVLFGMFIFKKFQTVQSRSDAMQDEELYGRPLEPRTRAYLYRILTDFCGLSVDDLYTRDRRGKVRTDDELLNNILSTVKQVLAAEAKPDPGPVKPQGRRKPQYRDNLSDCEDEGVFSSEESGDEWGGISDS
ncbi:hypothetical protein BKA70DRAFT_1482696 [Coprinopsis sp. MPI-PUGE-AT-0042]|nr:hypothetical protein BKA70DRAFT_1482696 [Coprinopsis sp. MPI-PUGE-AT-0042]